MKNVIFVFILVFSFLPSCTTYNEAEDVINIQVVTADLSSISDRLNQLTLQQGSNFRQLFLELNLVKNDLNKLILQGEINKENLLIIRSLLTQIEQTLIQVALTQQAQGGDLTEIKKQLLENYLLLLSINNNLGEVKTWTLDNKDKLNKLIALCGGLQNTLNTALNLLISQGITQAQMFERINAITLQITTLQGSVDGWGSIYISKIDQLGLTFQQWGITLGGILANTNNLLILTPQILAKLDALQLSVNELKAIHLAMVNHLNDIKDSITNLQATVNSLVAQVMLLHNADLDILVAINSRLCCCPVNNQPAPNIINSYNHVFNEYIDASTSISQIYNACSNGIGSCGNGLVPPSNVCMVINMINPYIQGNNNNVNYNFSSLNINAGNISNNFGC